MGSTSDPAQITAWKDQLLAGAAASLAPVTHAVEPPFDGSTLKMVPSNVTAEHVLFLVSAAVAFWVAIDGLRRGEVGFFLGGAKRSKDPPQFWLGVAVAAVLGLVLVSALFLD